MQLEFIFELSMMSFISFERLNQQKTFGDYFKNKSDYVDGVITAAQTVILVIFPTYYF